MVNRILTLAVLSVGVVRSFLFWQPVPKQVATISTLWPEGAPAYCSGFTDCFNCTLGSCSWDGKYCLGGKVVAPSFNSLTKDAAVCGDPLGVCSATMLSKSCRNKCDKISDRYDLVSLQYKNISTTIPKGYYCERQLQVRGISPVLFFNQSDSQWVFLDNQHVDDDDQNLKHQHLTSAEIISSDKELTPLE